LEGVISIRDDRDREPERKRQPITAVGNDARRS